MLRFMLKLYDKRTLANLTQIQNSNSNSKIKEFTLRINVDYFNFETISMDDVKILYRIIKKSYPSNSILTAILRMSIDIPLLYLT